MSIERMSQSRGIQDAHICSPFSDDGLFPDPYEAALGAIGEPCRGLGGVHGASFWWTAGMMLTAGLKGNSKAQL